MKTSSSLFLSFVLTALPAGALLAGNVYKWVDENGIVPYTDQKPNEREAEKLNVRTTQGRPDSAASADDPSAAVEDLNRQQEIQELGKRQVAEEEQEKKRKQELCDNARSNLEVIQNNARIKVNEKDTQRFLTPEEIIQKREQFEKILKENCQ